MTMQSAAHPIMNRDIVRAFCAWLNESGLPDFFACHDPLHPRLEHWTMGRRSAPRSLQPIIDLFILGREVPLRELAGAPGEVLAALTSQGILKSVGTDAVCLGGLVLLPLQGLWLLCQRPQPNPTLYFGDDSVALTQRLRARRGERALDLCSGPGIQALRLAQMGANVTAVELNPVAATLARINITLNDLEDRVDVRIASLYAGVPGERFDVIVANPPLLPIPDDMPYPFVGHGGPDGLRLTRQILDGLPEALSPRGVARLIGTTLSDGYLPLCVDELRRCSASKQLSIRMFITSHHGLAAGDPFFEGLCDTAAATGEIDAAAARRRFRTFLTEEKASHLCAYFFHVTPGSGGFDLIDLAHEPPADLWFV
jgi:release factor glutamine methyltransferase